MAYGRFLGLIACFFFLAGSGVPQEQPDDSRTEPTHRYNFDGAGSSAGASLEGSTSFVKGLEGQALRVGNAGTATLRSADGTDLALNSGDDFSVQFWVRTTADPKQRMVVLSHKHYPDNSLASQKDPGWVFYISDGTWAWNVGSGERRLTYERDNGEQMPANDGRWHQLAMTYDRALAEVRLYYDGQNKAIYNVHDSVGFDFSVDQSLVVGWAGAEPSPQNEILSAIYSGAEKLQALVDTFDGFGLDELASDELVNLIVEPRRLFEQKVASQAAELGAEYAAFRASMQQVDFEPVSAIEAELMRNPYTIHQAFSFMEAAPLLKIYSLIDGKVLIDEEAARMFTERERLYPADFDIDEVAVWNRPLSAEEVLESYAEHFEPVGTELEARTGTITAGVWNIFHGGKHFTIDEHGWDSRKAIAEILRRNNVDVVLMQETYSSGDFIAAELGYYFATTVDWDYLNQGANISVLSRYPIEEVHVDPESPFMTVATKIAISKTQRLHVMSNWYGMAQFSSVFAFNEPRFAESDTIPTLFGGDFNAVPHTDGGDSPASPVMLGAGFTDAYRSTYPSVEEFPGATHRSGRRIDQLYYKGRSLRRTATHLVTTWPTGFPSDHYLIVAAFEWIH